jgi:ribosomal protein S12 methylthiotransferase
VQNQTYPRNDPIPSPALPDLPLNLNKVTLISLGCAKNLVDSEVMLGYLKQAGYEPVADIRDANAVIINTCGFISDARVESEAAIQNALKEKSRFPKKKIVAAGCYVEVGRENLKNLYPEVDAWIGVKDFPHIVEALEGSEYSPGDTCFLYSHDSPRILSTPPGWAYVKIAEGCSHACSFCSIPRIKGRFQSRTIASIRAEAQNLADKGVKEIILTSQDSTYYGRDLGMKDGLSRLLEQLLDINGLEWIRILYACPEEVNPALIEIMQEEKICSYFDIPLQHADSRILKAMRRKTDAAQALKFIQSVRKQFPDIVLRTSLIVGFPGEGRREFKTLTTFVRQARFNHLGVFTYSRERHTPAYALGDPVKEEEKKERKQEIMEIQAGISARWNKTYLKRRLPVLVDGRLAEDPSVLTGRTRFQAPEADGMVYADTRNDRNDYTGKIIPVEITACDEYDLYGQLIP